MCFVLNSLPSFVVCRLLDYRESSQSCQSLIPMTVELRPSAKELKRDSINMGFMLPTEQVCVCVAINQHFLSHHLMYVCVKSYLNTMCVITE